MITDLNAARGITFTKKQFYNNYNKNTCEYNIEQRETIGNLKLFRTLFDCAKYNFDGYFTVWEIAENTSLYSGSEMLCKFNAYLPVGIDYINYIKEIPNIEKILSNIDHATPFKFQQKIAELILGRSGLEKETSIDDGWFGSFRSAHFYGCDKGVSGHPEKNLHPNVWKYLKKLEEDAENIWPKELPPNYTAEHLKITGNDALSDMLQIASCRPNRNPLSSLIYFGQEIQQYENFLKQNPNNQEAKNKIKELKTKHILTQAVITTKTQETIKIIDFLNPYNIKKFLELTATIRKDGQDWPKLQKVYEKLYKNHSEERYQKMYQKFETGSLFDFAVFLIDGYLGFRISEFHKNLHKGKYPPHKRTPNKSGVYNNPDSGKNTYSVRDLILVNDPFRKLQPGQRTKFLKASTEVNDRKIIMKHTRVSDRSWDISLSRLIKFILKYALGDINTKYDGYGHNYTPSYHHAHGFHPSGEYLQGGHPHIFHPEIIMFNGGITKMVRDYENPFDYQSVNLTNINNKGGLAAMPINIQI